MFLIKITSNFFWPLRNCKNPIFKVNFQRQKSAEEVISQLDLSISVIQSLAEQTDFLAVLGVKWLFSRGRDTR